MKKRILVAEDEDVIRDFIVINLKKSGYEVVEANNGERAINAYKNSDQAFDIVLLDIMMPGVDGVQVCKYIRERDTAVGIIMLSAKSQEMEKVNCLMIGADDYVTKPFSLSELLARIDAVCRRVSTHPPQTEAQNEIGTAHSNAEFEIKSGPFTVNTKSRTFLKNNEKIEITQVEFQILEFFMKNQETALDRTTILRHIWGEDYFGDDKIVDVNIRRLRVKIEKDPSNPEFIHTIWGYGYKWEIKN